MQFKDNGENRRLSRTVTGVALAIAVIAMATAITFTFLYRAKQQQEVKAQCQTYMVNEDTELILCAGLRYPDGSTAGCIVARQKLTGTEGGWWVTGFACR